MKNAVFVLGAPGSGKGTLCPLIVQNFGYVHLCAGELLREEKSNPDSKHVGLIEDCTKNGKIVPTEITLSLLREAMEKSGSQYFLIDGYPRNYENQSVWDRDMSKEVNLQFVLYFECPEDVCVQRCLKRSSGRSDDNVEILKKRFKSHVIDTLPVIEHYQSLGLLRKVDGNRTVDEVFADLKVIFEKEK